MWSGSSVSLMSSNESWLSVSIEPFGKGVADEFTEEEKLDVVRISKKYLRKNTVLNIIKSNIAMNHILHEIGRDGVDEVPGDWGEGLDDGNDDEDGNDVVEMDG